MQGRPPESYLYDESKNRFKKDVDGLRSYLPGHASLMEIMAVRSYYVLNACIYDGTETFIVSGCRVLGYSCRLALYLTSIVFIVYATCMAPVDVLFRYSFTRDRVNDELRTDGVSSDPAAAFLWLVFSVWIVSIFTCMSTYVMGRLGREGYSGQCVSAPFCLCMRSPLPGKFDSGNRCVMALFLMLWFAMLGTMASLTIYSVMAHLYVKRNVYFAYFLAVMTIFTAGGALADALSIGGIDGIRVTSPHASFLAALRAVVIVPIQVIVTTAFLFFVFPPWSSA